MKSSNRLTHFDTHTCILWILVIAIIISIVVMITRQMSGTIVDQHWQTTQIAFLGTTGDKAPTIKAEIADTPYKHEYGLMFRGQINWGDGMLFIFPKEQIKSFWMKNTYIPLDMIFVNASGSIVSIYRGAKPNDETPISSIFPAKYVIEVNSGWTMEAGLTTGDYIDITTLH